MILTLLVVQVALGLLTIPFSAQHMDGSEMMKLVAWAQAIVTFHGGASKSGRRCCTYFKCQFLGMTIFIVPILPFSFIFGRANE